MSENILFPPGDACKLESSKSEEKNNNMKCFEAREHILLSLAQRIK